MTGGILAIEQMSVDVTLLGQRFKAVGVADQVHEQYKAWVKLVEQNIDAILAGVKEPQPIESPMKLAFSRKGDFIALRRLPQTSHKNADALLLLIYGFRELLGQERVLGTRLMRAARLSSMKIDRVDRFLRPNAELVITVGKRKGLRYGLNGPGIGRAEDLVKNMSEGHKGAVKDEP